MLTVIVVSDATGGTAERIVRSALTQFEDAPVDLIYRRNVRSAEQIRYVVQEAAAGKCMIVHTLVSDELRQLMLAGARSFGVDSLDVIGPILDRLAVHLDLTPQEQPGLWKQLSDVRSREIEAVDFAFHHDDGQHADDLKRAEVVLVGISRTMKTPTMLYLAYRGWFAANVPIVPGVPLPTGLLSTPPRRVFCLAMGRTRLRELRLVRADQEAIPVEPYASPEVIRKELQRAEQLCLEHGWRRIEVTGKSVEEVSREIIALLPHERHGATGDTRQ
ncbi:MAG: kinase/pyrophosphorylase [Candidatus Nealsonbacteria bacterium]|nr:kinase/pyrophosphorylase [Candidatus Nealsonbacteria bacterium]